MPVDVATERGRTREDFKPSCSARLQPAWIGLSASAASAVDTADLLDRAAGGDGAPDWLGIPALLPDVPATIGEAADHFADKAMDKIEGTG